jgi:putative transposase
MNEYRDGATYFVTLECYRREPLLARPQLKKILLDAIHDTKKQFSLHLGGFVILDDHAHLVFIASANSELSALLHFLRARFTRAWRELEKTSTETPFWDHDVKSRVLADHDDLRAHLDYVHYDPVRHGVSERAYDYQWSSLHVRVDQGHYSEDWGVLGPPASLGRFAEHGS